MQSYLAYNTPAVPGAGYDTAYPSFNTRAMESYLDYDAYVASTASPRHSPRSQQKHLERYEVCARYRIDSLD